MADSSKDTSEGKSESLTTLPISSSTTESNLSEQLRKLVISFRNPKDREATLSTLRRIFDNIIEHPNDDKYRQIKLTGKTFSSKVWQYPAGEELMKMSGWVVEDDHVTLRDDSCVQIVAHLLILREAELNKNILRPSQCSLKVPSTILGKRGRVNTDDTRTNHFTFTDERCASICSTIVSGKGVKFKEITKQYDPCFIQNVQVNSSPLIAFAFSARQIGIVRILVNEYGVDANSFDEQGCPWFINLFDGCDSTESCQALIIQFIKEFEVDVDKYRYDIKTLHIAVLHKLFTVIRFLVEDCKVDVNCTTSTLFNGGTALHMAYGIGEKNIAQYLIEHGADQDATDGNGSKPKDYELYWNPTNAYSLNSKFLCMKRIIWKSVASDEFKYFTELCVQGLPDYEAVDLTYKKFPHLQEAFDGGVVSRRNLDVTPTLNELNRYITDMAPSYYDIGLQLDIVNSKLRLIENDPSFPNLREKCRKMLQAWLDNDNCATWKKLCDALQEVGRSVLAEQIKNSQ